MNIVDNKIKEYENFLEDVLKKDLKEINIKLNQSVEKYEEWENLQNTIRIWQTLNEKDLKMLVPLGSNINVNATAEEYDKLLVDIGVGCLLEMSFEEALKYSNIRMKVLKKDIDHYRQLAVHVKVKMKLVLLGINELTLTK
ncbi:mediator of rna polymerase ii transcription subunit 10 [Holotrichia oblita]|uniref:Mediator of rna polymerase ii transcription subunit 10 n=1 Tax=Holotrichia oblita TaxID=644536 RepID=A0ACB9TUV3_HOLOL|nr:mediator of rna polymerase ii transcription subunit 10 [Holotrichia oblita]